MAKAKPKSVVVVDPGHGFPDPGVIGPAGTQEADVTLAVGKLLADVLTTKHKLPAVLTRSDRRMAGTPPEKATSTQAISSRSLQHRVNMAALAKAGAFISLHCSTHPHSTAAGFEVTYNTSGATLGKAVYQALKEAFPAHKARRCERGDTYVLRKNPVPAALVALEFLSNPEQEKFLRSREAQEDFAAAMARGIEAASR